MIGETLEDENDICGAVVSIRRNEYRVQLWTQTAINKELQVGAADQQQQQGKGNTMQRL